MTDRLYYTDPYLTTFDATVARVDRRDDRLLVALDRTAFYPTSGGQPFDTGTLGALRVVDVVDEDDGIDRARRSTRPLRTRTPMLCPGQRVHGDIDWPRRFDHMQQHTGQHVLSAAFDRLFGVRTVSFHLGAAVSTIDLAREVSPARDRSGRDRGQPHRLGGSAGHDPVRRRGGSGAAAAAQGAGARRHAAADRRGAASTCRRAAARTWRAPAASASLPSPPGSDSKAGSGSSSSVVAARSTGTGRCATQWQRASDCCRCCPTIFQRPSNGCRPTPKNRSGRWRRCRPNLLAIAARSLRRPGKRSSSPANGGMMPPCRSCRRRRCERPRRAGVGDRGEARLPRRARPPSVPALAVIARSADVSLSSEKLLAC